MPNVLIGMVLDNNEDKSSFHNTLFFGGGDGAVGYTIAISELNRKIPAYTYFPIFFFRIGP